MKPIDAAAPPAGGIREVLAALTKMDGTTLRESTGTIAGVKIPSLTTYERLALNLAPTANDTSARLADVAIARCRAAMVSGLLEESADPDRNALIQGLPVEDWREEMRAARDTLRVAVAARVVDGIPAAVREMRDLQKSFDAASDQIERLYASAGVGVERRRAAPPHAGEQPSAAFTFERKPNTVEAEAAAAAALAPSARAPQGFFRPGWLLRLVTLGLLDPSARRRGGH